MCHDRFSEHTRAANNPASYKDNSIGKHYNAVHNGKKANLHFYILDRQPVTVRRKISEALKIKNMKPSINSREERIEALKFLVKYNID